MSDAAPAPLHLFAGYGVEIEYAIVDRQTLAVLPVADEVLRSVTGEYTSDFEDGPVAWSNELVLHVIELKTTDPAPALEPLPPQFQEHVGRINELLAPLGGRLMPSDFTPRATGTRRRPPGSESPRRRGAARD